MQKAILLFEFFVFVLTTTAVWWLIVKKVLRNTPLEFIEDDRGN